MEKNDPVVYWQRYEPMIQAIVELFHPFVEVSIHDLREGKVVALYHNLSQRKVGDPSVLQELKANGHEFPDHFAPYFKTNWDGRTLKCSSVTIRNQQNEAIALICFNVDISSVQNANRLIESFLHIKEDGEHALEACGSNCEEQATNVLQQYLNEKNLSLAHLNRNQKKEAVQHLYNKGVFNFKNAAPFIAHYLNLSRASIYNYIKQISPNGHTFVGAVGTSASSKEF